MEQMSEYRDWKITLTFTVPPGDVEGNMTEALYEAALKHAPAEARGMVARADTRQGKVWVSLTLVNTSRGLADEVAQAMPHRVRDEVVSGDAACVSAG